MNVYLSIGDHILTVSPIEPHDGLEQYHLVCITDAIAEEVSKEHTSAYRAKDEFECIEILQEFLSMDGPSAYLTDRFEILR